MSAESLTVSLTRFRYRLAEFPEAVVLISFGVLFLFFALAAEHFLSAVALTNILSFSSILGIMVVGVAMLMIHYFELEFKFTESDTIARFQANRLMIGNCIVIDAGTVGALQVR